MGEPHQIDVRLDGTLLKRFTIGGEGKGMTAPESFAGNTQGDPQWEEYMHTADAGLTVRVPVTAGTHQVGVSFVRRHWEPEGVLQPPQRGFARTTNELYFGNPSVDSVSIAGPHTARRDERTRRPSQGVRLPSHESGGGRTVRATHSVDDRAPGVSRPGERGRPQHADRLLSSRPSGGRIRGRHSAWAPPHPRRRRAFCFASSVSRRPQSRPAVSRHRSRPRVATVLLPVEQHSGR